MNDFPSLVLSLVSVFHRVSIFEIPTLSEFCGRSPLERRSPFFSSSGALPSLLLRYFFLIPPRKVSSWEASMEDGREGRDSLTESVGRDCWRRTFLIVIVIAIDL